jgi:pSer/pThr/pTyr-binding forkhead associated (FHA) protein
MVDGIYCSRSHFNSPDAIFCTACGISMVQQTHNRVLGPRPPLGVLVTDDGAVFSLVHDYVVGREPGTAAEVLAGTAHPIALDDPKVAMSRVHARILLDGWEVRVEDATSANGTFVGHGDDDWTRLAPGVPTTIKAGTRIAVGGRTLTFETHQRS